ncbi:mitochondrial carrier domain-containing protein [Dactylonectria macrodidyma]|uniref:Mitochondrial carrier domain-containing protein n=1 Tax=Dactylonectria macrodidyma TaxID=307937 RepID=A0A9P9DC19_9HYPO|nr:mitochondrial carrier domain-containing protein [Dactylonectria macrodidyma]
MPRKYHESSPSRPQNSENTHLRTLDHELCPHESISYLSHLEQLTACFSDTSIRSFAGATSGVASSVIICPLDVVKTKLQGRGGLQLWTLDSVSTRRSFRERGLIGTGRAIWHQGGLAGMATTYVGILKRVRSCWRYLFYIIDESIVGYQDQTHVSKCRSEDRCLTGSGLGNWHEDQGWLQVLGILTASSASKACATVVTYPHEVIRTRLQTQRKIYPIVLGCNGGTSREKFPHLYRGIISTLGRILREEGWRALYSGMGTSLLGAIPASATTMLVYEIVVRLIKKSRTTGNRKLQLQDTIE